MPLALTPEQRQRYEAFRRWRDDWDVDGGAMRDAWKIRVRNHKLAGYGPERPPPPTALERRALSAVDRAIDAYVDDQLYLPGQGIFSGPARILHEGIQEAARDGRLERWEYLLKIAETFMAEHPAPGSAPQ